MSLVLKVPAGDTAKNWPGHQFLLSEVCRAILSGLLKTNLPASFFFLGFNDWA